jgi:hypothetical protein
MISGFRSEADDSCALLGCYTASGNNCLPTFLDNLSVPSTRVRNPKFPEVRKETKHYPFYCYYRQTDRQTEMCPAGNNLVTFSLSWRPVSVYKGVQGAENKSSTQSRLELFETFQSATAVNPTSPRPIQICKFQVYKASVVQMTVYFGGHGLHRVEKNFVPEHRREVLPQYPAIWILEWTKFLPSALHKQFISWWIVFWVFPRRLSIKSRLFGTLHTHTHSHFTTCWRWNRECSETSAFNTPTTVKIPRRQFIITITRRKLEIYNALVYTKHFSTHLNTNVTLNMEQHFPVNHRSKPLLHGVNSRPPSKKALIWIMSSVPWVTLLLDIFNKLLVYYTKGWISYAYNRYLQWGSHTWWLQTS